MRIAVLRHLAGPALTAVLLAGAYAIAVYPHHIMLAGRPAAPARSVSVTTALRGCPAPGIIPASVAMVAAPASGTPGQAQVTRLDATGSTLLYRVAQPGRLSLLAVRAAAAAPQRTGPSQGPAVPTVSVPGGVMVSASGAMARGLEVEQVTAGAGDALRCDQPGTDFWFVGPGQHDAARIQLFLLNLAGSAADANVQMATDAGPVQGSTDTGINVPPHSMIVQSLGSVLRGSRVIALNVRTSVGQVVASVEEITGTGRGGGWLPATASPATHVIMPGMPSVPGTRQLFVAVPGTQDAHLQLTAITTRGSYQPTGGGGLDIPAGSAVEIALPSLAGIPGALSLSANVPISASLMLPGGAVGAPGAFVAASQPIIQQGMVAENRSGAGATSELVLSAPGRAVAAVIRAGALGAGQTVRIAAGHSLVVQLSGVPGADRKAPFPVEITPLAGSGPLYAGRAVESNGAGGQVESVLPVISALTSVPLPAVRQAFITTAP